MKKRAFTLTELLVVVVIVGVLSAVVLPKFTKILQTRKTTEAENVMAAVRNEQEARCMVGRDYTADTDKLASLPKATSKNYTYTLDAQGITATAKDGEYVLQIPSYTDGRICCMGKDCEHLNKDYPRCDDTTFVGSLEQATCEVPEVTEVPEPEPEVQPEPEPEPSCDENAKPATSQKCTPTGYSTECGKQTRSVKCDASTNYEWQHTDWGTCQETSECNNSSTCTDGETRIMGETGDGCANAVQTCVDGEWDSKTEIVLKEESECWVGQSTAEKACVSCHWQKCPSNKVEIDGVCCLPGQKVVNGQCLYKYRPNRFAVNILVVCHSSSYELTMDPSAIISEEQFNSGYMGYKYQYSSYAEYKEAIIRQNSGTQGRYGGGMGNKPAYCSAMGYSYYRGGNIPWVNGGPGDCDWHYAYYNGGNWWVGGTRVQGNQVYGSDQDWCDTNCGQKTSCDTKGIVDRGNPPGTCDSYHCSNGWHCDNAPGGTGVALECIREY